MSPHTPIHLHKTGLMQRLVTNVAHGYHWHYTGTVAADRVFRFIDHIEQQYATAATTRHREYRRARYDRANAFLHCHPSYTAPEFHWWLMLTDGNHEAPVPPSPLKDARGKGDQRLIVPGDFEAVLRPSRGGVPRRTWQLTTDSYQTVAARLQEAIRHRTDGRVVVEILREIHSYPAFRGVRSQVANLRKLAVGEWRRVKPATAALVLPPFPPYLRYRLFETIPISIVRDRLLAGRKPFPWKRLAMPVDGDALGDGPDFPLLHKDSDHAG